MSSNNEQNTITIEDVDRELNSIVSKIQVLQDVRRFCEDIEVELWFKRLSAANKALEQDISPSVNWLSWSGEVEEWGKIKCPMFNDEMVTTYYPKGASCVYTYTAPFVA